MNPCIENGTLLHQNIDYCTIDLYIDLYNLYNISWAGSFLVKNSWYLWTESPDTADWEKKGDCYVKPSSSKRLKLFDKLTSYRQKPLTDRGEKNMISYKVESPVQVKGLQVWCFVEQNCFLLKFMQLAGLK